MLAAIVVLAILSAMTVVQVAAGLQRSRALGAARYLAARVAAVRSEAARRSRHVALRFDDAASGYALQMFVDNDGDGVRSADIADGTDTPIAAIERVQDTFPGVELGLVDDALAPNGPVVFGAAGLLSWSPTGTSTPGSVYLKGSDGSQYVVRVLGATGRTRVQRHDVVSGKWVDLR